MSYDKYDSYSEGTAGGDFDVDPELKVTSYTMIEGDLDRVFGSDSPYGHSLGMPLGDVNVLDGALYVDNDVDDADDITLKLFSWKEATGFSIAEALDRGETPTADDAPDVLPKTYGDTHKTYELVGARVMGDEDAELEPSSVMRDYDFDEDEEDLTFDEFVDLEGEPVSIGDVIMWHGTSDSGATATATRNAAILTRFGEEAVTDEDAQNWLVDTSGDNIIRDDLEGRRIRYIVVEKPSEENEGRYWNKPVIEDEKTGEQLSYNNEGEEGN